MAKQHLPPDACSLPKLQTSLQFACNDQVCHIGDALAEDAVVPGGFAGLVVDLFADGQILPALREVQPSQLAVWSQSSAACIISHPSDVCQGPL